MNAYTPGSWTIIFRAGAWLIRSGGRSIAQLVAEDAQDKANAHLIAAAPELLEALRDLREAATEAYKIGRIDPEPFVRAGNVIAKAIGEVK